MGEANQEESCWGMLVDCESYGRHGDTKHDYKIISYEDAKTQYKEHMHASHGMLYAKNDFILWDLYSTKAAILMQLRFDGLLGFPGGLVDPGEDPVTGLNREMHEEIALDLNKHSFKDENHSVTFLHEKKKLVLHFYIKEVTLEEFKGIEEKCPQAHEYGIETLGSFRPPLFTMGDNFRGFPTFLCN
ncbi:U8 snoRNA-decapping enzyme-like [Mercenaria mercenaria]|uniref:U8 snoRNA-decapping enzyme-like n=1 Tax=Mercenaria mercenaria TaxID=6596 RepID=UPI00234F6F90|nr:U8 snoRNA-decapping enzyme-like [Mercenaria mercenaria]